MTKPQKKPFGKRDLIEYGVLIGIAILLYATGLHTEVIGRLQSVILWTGIFQPDVSGARTDGKPAGALYFVTEDGTPGALQDYSGRTVFINFWATWCPPCIAEMPSINRLYNRLRHDDRIVFLMVSLDDEFETARAFRDSRGFGFPVVHFRGRSPGDFENALIPTTYVVSPDGRLLLEKSGMAKYDTKTFEAFLKQQVP